MYYPRTERQERFMACAAELAAKFAPRATEHDRAGTFPFENYEDLRAARLPRLVIPEEFGGWGANLAETVMTMEVLAAGDGSTALSVTMHMQTMGAAVESGSWPEPLLARVCRDIVERNALINSCATEPELGSPQPGRQTQNDGHARDADADGNVVWTINGRKNFASMSPVLDYLIVPAALLDDSGQVARFVVPKSERVEIVETWDAMGMRATGSHDIVLHDVQVGEDRMLGRSDSTKLRSKGPVNAWFMLVISAVYVGVAGAALDAAARYAQERVPTALGKPIATLEGIQRHLGQAELLLQQARLPLYHLADVWDRHPDRQMDLGPAIIAAKVTAANNVIQAVDHCMRVVGGAGMTRALPLERYYRDVRGGLTHPVNEDQALIMFGQLALRKVTAELPVHSNGNP